MKLVVEVPKEYYDALRQAEIIIKGQRSGKTLESVTYSAIANGKSLDSVLDEIKAEITQRHLSINEKSEFDNGRTYAYEEVIDIIDKYKKGESE